MKKNELVAGFWSFAALVLFLSAFYSFDLTIILAAVVVTVWAVHDLVVVLPRLFAALRAGAKFDKDSRV